MSEQIKVSGPRAGAKKGRFTLKMDMQMQFDIKGLEDIKKDKNKCQGFFDKYKECMKKEKEASLERNRDRSLFS